MKNKSVSTARRPQGQNLAVAPKKSPTDQFRAWLQACPGTPDEEAISIPITLTLSLAGWLAVARGAASENASLAEFIGAKVVDASVEGFLAAAQGVEK